MTRKLFYDDWKLEQAEATLISLDTSDGKCAAILDATPFYPEGGGQPCDLGTIGGASVVDVVEKDGLILHYIEPKDATKLKTGTVKMIIDASRRRDYATQHTAQHLLSATILRLIGKPTLSMHLGEEVNTIDVDAPSIEAQDLQAAEEAVYEVIEADYPVIAHFCPPERIEDFPLRKRPPQGEEVIRVIEIDGYDYSPCCGAHLTSTGPIGLIKIVGAEKYKGLTRVSFVAGKRAFRDYCSVRTAAETVASRWGVRVEELDSRARLRDERLATCERALMTAKDKLAQIEAAQLASSGGALHAAAYGDKAYDDVLLVGRAAQKLSGAVILVASVPDRRAALLCSVKGVDLRGPGKRLMELSGGKGGGGPSLFQVAFDSKTALESFIAAAKEEFR